MKNAKWPAFRIKLNLVRRKPAIKFFFHVKTVSDGVVRHSPAYQILHKWLAGDGPLNVNFVPKVKHTLAQQRCAPSLWNWKSDACSGLYRNDNNAVRNV